MHETPTTTAPGGGAFECSPIPRDPTAVFFMGDAPPAADSDVEKRPAPTESSFCDPEAEDMTGLRMELAATLPAQSTTPTMALVAGRDGQVVKRQRLEAESAAIVKNDQLALEFQTLQTQLQQKNERHQLELKRRDFQLDQLRRQLQFATAEEENTRKELRQMTNDLAMERLQSKKRIVELESRLQFVEASLAEQAEKALEFESDCKVIKRKSQLQIQLLSDELEAVKKASFATPDKNQSLQESRIALLEARLREKELEADIATKRLADAGSTLDAEKVIRTLKQRVTEMEAHERKLKAQLVELIESSKQSSLSDEKLSVVRQKLAASEKRHAEAQEEINRLRELDAGKLKLLLEQAERELANYELRLGRGELNPATTKVVHLSVNPTSELLRDKQQVINELDRLRKENQQLRDQAGAKEHAELSTPTSSTPASSLTTTTSYETVEGQKRLNQRLKEAFHQQIQQYRDAVHQLTGYKVDLKKSNGVELLRLRSMYADRDDDELLVRMEPSGGLELLETDFCGQIDQRVFAYLKTCRSFPAFLSTLTLHLFEKQTFQG